MRRQDRDGIGCCIPGHRSPAAIVHGRDFVDADARTGPLVVIVNKSFHPGVYHVLAGRTNYPIEIAVRVVGEPSAFAGQLHDLAAEVAPALRVERAIAIDRAGQGDLIAYDAWFRVIVLAVVMAILLTNAGIYAVISFTVARRTREIGVRVALGADRRQCDRRRFRAARFSQRTCAS